jgi:hypothetical protein
MDHRLHRPVIAPLAAMLALSLALAAPRPAAANTPDGAYGTYHVTVFLPESNGETDPSTEDWTPEMEAEVVNESVEGCMFWADNAPAWAGLTCHVTFYHYVDTPTQYEPISRDGGVSLLGFLFGGEEGDWINDLMTVVGYSSMWLPYYEEVEDYNDAQQEAYGTDEAFSIFVANSFNDEDGNFANGDSAYVLELRAPHLTMTWDNGGWRAALGSISLRHTAAHEMGHIFGAEDEYAESNSSCDDESNGYTNDNHELCPGGPQTDCLMGVGVCSDNWPEPICYWTRGMVGWEPECPPLGLCDLMGPWKCYWSSECIDLSARCDGIVDCQDAADEFGCSPCAEREFLCPDRGCEPYWEYCLCDDADSDGYRVAGCGGGDDCDDLDAEVYPGAAETCGDGVDQDCSGGDLACACDDADGDGFQDEACGGDDCDDSSRGVHPGAAETCGDGVDQDCSGSDQVCGCDDADGDGFQDRACGGDDCDDSNEAINPGQAEVCGDDIDQDCSGADMSCSCDDGDGDGHQARACGGDDCNDGDRTVHPDAAEVCGDGIDQDCSGVDLSCDCADADLDGFQDSACGGDDCDDGDRAINPRADEVCGDGLDQDCSGRDEICGCADADGDGAQDAACGGDDCDDRNGAVFPGAAERCEDGIDQDCSGADLSCSCPDADGDGFYEHTCGGTDCDDGTAAVGGFWPNCGDDGGCDCVAGARPARAAGVTRLLALLLGD